MTGTSKRPDDPLNRLTGSASHEAAYDTGTDPVEAGEALEADAVMAEADAVIARDDAQPEHAEPEHAEPEHAESEHPEPEHAEAEQPPHLESEHPEQVGWGDSAAAARARRTPVPEYSEAPTVAIGRASVAPPPMESPFPGSPFFGAAVARSEDESAPGESYDELLGGIGERPEEGPAESPRPVSAPYGWERTLLRFGQGAMWTLPVAAICLALSGMWGWPTLTAEPAGASPGTWLVVTVFGLVFALTGVVAMTALLSITPGRRPALAALVMVLSGSLLLAPMLGLVALGRSAATRMEQRIGPDATAELDARFLDHTLGRWLGLGGLMLVGLGWLAMGAAVLASRILNRVDGYLLLCAVIIAAGGVYLSWQFLITVAAMVLLAAGLGLSWTAFKLEPAKLEPANLEPAKPEPGDVAERDGGPSDGRAPAGD